MQTEVLILTIAAHSLHDSHPFSLIFTLLKVELYRLKPIASSYIHYDS